MSDHMVLMCRRCGFLSNCRSLGDRCPTDATLLLPRSTLEEARRDPVVGRLLGGRYLTLTAITRHDATTLYHAHDLQGDQAVSIKAVTPYAVGAAERVQQLAREARVLRRVRHSTLPRLIDSGRAADGLSWLALSPTRGVTLRSLLDESERLTPERAINIALRTLAAVDQLHAQGLVHGDLRPETILVLPGGIRGSDEVKLIDCGKARPMGAIEPPTDRGETATYRTPEQFLERPVSVETDMYVIGLLLYEMLVGRPPFSGQTTFERMLNHCRMPVPAAGLGERLETLEGVMQRAMAKAPHRRWRNARAMALALKAAFVTKDPRISTAPPAARPIAGWQPPRPHRGWTAGPTQLGQLAHAR